MITKDCDGFITSRFFSNSGQAVIWEHESESLNIYTKSLQERVRALEKKLSLLGKEPTPTIDSESLVKIRDLIKEFNPKHVLDFKIEEGVGQPLLSFKFDKVSVAAIEEATKIELLITEKISNKILFK